MKITGAGVAAASKGVVFSDFDMNLRMNPSTSDVSRITNSDAVKQSIRNIIQTNTYERLFNAKLAGNLDSYLFENINPLTAWSIKSEISYAITNYEKRAVLLGVTVTPKSSDDGYDVFVTYRVQNATTPDTVSVLLERVR